MQLPPGGLRFSEDIDVPSGVTLRGSGRGATTLWRAADVSLRFHGEGPADRAPRNINCGVEHINLEGGDFTAPMLDLMYASQFQLSAVRVFGCEGPALACTEVWDSAFTDLFADWCGRPGRPAVWIRNSRGIRDHAGWSPDTSNQLRFRNLHLETFGGTAIRIEAGVDNTAPPNGIWFSGLKCESAQIGGGPVVEIGAACQGVKIGDAYFSLNAFADGQSSPVDVIDVRATGQCAIRDVAIVSADDDLVRSGVRVETSGPLATTVLDSVAGTFGRAPEALIDVVQAGRLSIRDPHTNAGTLIRGWP